VEIASRFRSFDPGDATRQARLRTLGGRLADRLLRHAAEGTFDPALWFTYHLYHKAPDWLGPAVTAGLGIPYMVAEASYAPKQAGGPWDLGHSAVAEALKHAHRVFQLNPADTECVMPLLGERDRLVPLPPFLETAPLRAPERPASRAAIAAEHRIDAAKPWLLTVAMMRSDQKLLSYRVLARALEQLTDLPWHFLVVGSGPAEADVRTAFTSVRGPVSWIPIVDREQLIRLYRAADLYLWPAVKEAYGMALLEAQAAGLAVVAGRSGGVPSIVADGETGVLVKEGDAAAFAEGVRALLEKPERIAAMGEAAMRKAGREHDLAAAAALLDRHLRSVAREAA
jgi:glycosyltransferase involved in cell wall biosynthesis